MNFEMDRSRLDLSDMSRRVGEIIRRCNRIVDAPLTRKRLVILVLILVFTFLYIGPNVLRWLFYTNSGAGNAQDICQTSYLAPYEESDKVFDAYIRRVNPSDSNELHNTFVPYIGNGYFGLVLNHDAHFNIKHRRTLSLPIYFHPLYLVNDPNYIESTVADYMKGIVARYQCGTHNLQIAYEYYAHRTLPGLLVQEIKFRNLGDSQQIVGMSTPRVSDWPTAVKQVVKFHQGITVLEYEAVTGMIEIPNSDKVIAASIVSRKLPSAVTVDARNTKDFMIMTMIQYSDLVPKEDYARQKDIVEKKAIDALKKAISISEKTSHRELRNAHSYVWRELWYTGFYISSSKAQGVINGDQINATMYTVLSQVPSFEHEDNIHITKKSDIMRTLTYSEGCYEGHSTLEAENLWRPLDSLKQINSVVGSWILTLEKQGCHNLLKAGASGASQAMVLSFGSLRFSNQHLEYNIHPSKLHRDFLFRRVNYGNQTHVNISVAVQEDNKAIIAVALDRSDKMYYACDAGCLDDPVQLGPSKKIFPVKLTEPLTAILYITSDKQHMEDLRLAIHVKEVVEAPAHEHHIIALHKHGHGLGGLHPLFWVSIGVLIILFHLFLCRIIMTEYCDNNNYRRLYNKP